MYICIIADLVPGSLGHWLPPESVTVSTYALPQFPRAARPGVSAMDAPGRFISRTGGGVGPRGREPATLTRFDSVPSLPPTKAVRDHPEPADERHGGRGGLGNRV